MPKDDWAKYARRDRARRAAAERFRNGEVSQTFEDLVFAAQQPKKRRKKRNTKSPQKQKFHNAPKNPRRTVRVTQHGFTIDYLGTPETATVRIVVAGDLRRRLPWWPGF